jgi:hypothetical protein
MTSGLDSWVKQAARRLSTDSAAQVRREISEHFESARAAALSTGASADEAERRAIAALGSPQIANRQYRKVLLTSAEAALLRRGNAEARFVCSRPAVRWLMRAIPVSALTASWALYLYGSTELARVLLAAGLSMALLFLAPFLPIYTPARGRVFRVIKWAAVVGMLLVAFGSDALQWSWLLASSLAPLTGIEIARAAIRRKLPVEQWPRQLYL